MSNKIIDNIKDGVGEETLLLANILLKRLLRKLPPHRWWFIPRDRSESLATNAITTMLRLDFNDIFPVTLLPITHHREDIFGWFYSWNVECWLIHHNVTSFEMMFSDGFI